MNKWINENDNVSYVMDREGKMFRVCIEGTLYKQCAMCGRFYVVDGNNTKYCGHCRRKAHSLKTVESRHELTTV